MDEITPSGATATADSSVGSTTTEAPPASTATSSAPDGSIASTASTEVQGATTETDPLEGVPSLDELNTLPDTAQYKKSLIQLRSAFEPLKTQFDQLNERFQPYQPILDRFEKPEELQSLVDLQSNLLGWASDPQTGEPVPATEAGAQKLAELYPLHADYLTADLLDLPTKDPVTGQTVPRIDIVLAGMAEDPEQRARALKILGGVEPGSVAPQWAASEEELAVVKPELQDFYKTLPWEDRDELKALSPEYLNKTLAQMKLTDDLQQDRQQSQQREQQRQQQREQYVNQQASQAGESYLGEQLQSALSTFHESVVQQSNFLQPLDPQSLPDGVTPEQATQINAQIAASNKAEAAQITGLIVSLFNPQTSRHVIPLLKEIGAIDDRLLSELNEAGSRFGNSARNFGNLQYRGKLTTNGNGYQPTADVTTLGNEAARALKTMVAYANQIKSKVIEHRSNFFALKAQQHNATLNGSPQVRPSVNGSAYDPTRSVSTANRIPAGGLPRDDINRLYG